MQIIKCLKSFHLSFGPLSLHAPKVGLHTMLCVSFSLVILVVMNLGLFFKLWAMEDIAHRMYLSTKHRLRERSEARWDDFPSLCIMHPLGLLSILDSDDVSCCHEHSQSRCLGVGGERMQVSLPPPFWLCCLISPLTREPYVPMARNVENAFSFYKWQSGVRAPLLSAFLLLAFPAACL